MTVQDTVATESSEKVKCEICGDHHDSIQLHLKSNHPEITIEEYKERWPEAEVLSDRAKSLLVRKAREKAAKEKTTETPLQADLVSTAPVKEKKAFNELFDLGTPPAAMNTSPGRAGQPIMIDHFSGYDMQSQNYVRDVDEGYVFNIDLAKKVIMGFQMNIPIYLWGFHGTGKTSMLQQCSARTGRPFLRVQHTVNMQESDVVGQWIVKDGATIFQLGPLPLAMINGWVYCADEYDTAMPNVVTVYQSVLEGEALMIKEAPPHMAKIVPHPDFRFVATGNTNGGGDETGLYQGTIIQNAANFSRFGITEQVDYMSPEIEVNIIQSRTSIGKADAKKLVKFANEVRKSFADGIISMPISPRELITATRLGKAVGLNWSLGLKSAYANRLSRVDGEAVSQMIQRLFGGS